MAERTPDMERRLRDPSLQDFIDHAARFGEEGVVDTAREFLDDEQIKQLRRAIREQRKHGRRERVQARIKRVEDRGVKLG